MDEVPLTRDKLALLDAIDHIIPLVSKRVGPMSQGLAGLSHALDALGPTKPHQGHKPPINIDKLEMVKFPANIPEQAKPTQMLFMKAILILALPAQVVVVVLTTNPRIPAQYNGLMATSAASKGKQPAVLLIEDNSNYGESHSKEEEEEEEGEMPAQYFQHIHHNKKLAKKKANRAKVMEAIAH
ncbi:hypothetical protein C0992_003244 [Termitomyces sp. T32_za158]|nr:hypothetical protein C0992_003244 [Termitomyces sp. T32_za158]